MMLLSLSQKGQFIMFPLTYFLFYNAKQYMLLYFYDIKYITMLIIGDV